MRKLIGDMLRKSMLKDKNLVPIFSGDEIIEFVYRKRGE